MGKATIYDYARMCKANIHKCENCPMWNYNCTIYMMDSADVDQANEITLNWCKERPVETRQERFLKMFPNAKKDEEVINIDPCIVDETFYQASPCWECAKKRNVEDCEECRKNYWLAEVDENGNA